MAPRLPPWTSLLLVAVALVLVPLLFLVPRPQGSHLAWDTLLEALPFIVGAVALAAAAFSAPGGTRTAGIVLAALLVLAPLWWPPAYSVAQDLSGEPSRWSVSVTAVPADPNATYRLVLPVPQLDPGEAPQHPRMQGFPDAATVTVDAFTDPPVLLVEGSGTASVHLVGVGSERPAWVGALGVAEGPLTLVNGNTTVSFTASFVWEGGCVEERWTRWGAAGPDGEGTLHRGRFGMAC